MNANEFADELEEFSGNGAFKYYLEIATMLRQQQAEIDLLRTTQPNIDYEKELLKPTFVGRELTDEEIEEVFEETIRQPNFMMLGDTQRFAKAILRKAQEK